jgi:hypothetical protein
LNQDLFEVLGSTAGREHSFFMAGLSNIRGLLLEEVLLHLLETTGYTTVTTRGNDPTLQNGNAGLRVKGRGCSHQIDAIADFRISHPFSHPQRLLVEAKCFKNGKKVPIEVARQAVGILKDVGEHWVPVKGVPKERYHYQYALFSATGYTSETQRYAFAQDIYLIPLGGSAFFDPIIDAIRRVVPVSDKNRDDSEIKISMKQLRTLVRKRLKNLAMATQIGLEGFDQVFEGLERFFVAAHRIQFALLAVVGKRFPVFFVPGPVVRARGVVDDEYRVRILRRDDDKKWILTSREDDRELFSFNLPRELFLKYAKQETLTDQEALDLKQNEMSIILAYYVANDNLRTVRFSLDQDWVSALRQRL